MKFALLGDHADGRALAGALLATGRHHLLYHVAAQPMRLADPHPPLRKIGDAEEALADPAVELVIVASRSADRPAQLRRALQSERHVVCVHPVEDRPATAYEAGLIQGDTRRVLLPILTEALHPAVVRLRQLIGPGSLLGPLRTLDLDRWWQTSDALVDERSTDQPSFPGWQLLRSLGGEIVEVSALSVGEELLSGEPLLLAGRFEGEGLFQVRYLPGQHRTRWRLRATAREGEVELYFPDGPDGAAFLSWPQDNQTQEECWPAWDPWPGQVAILEQALAGQAAALTWSDEVRLLELDDAARRSLERHRTSTLEFQEASEEVGFRGLMTLAGCGLLLLSVALLVAMRWLPWAGWVLVPLLVLFLLLQLLGPLVRRASPPARPSAIDPPSST